jgi:outer membrane PBP1 activator LpoA protein
MPALAYHFAGDLPIYGTSTLVQGAAGVGLRELEGARVTELPWRVYPDPVRDAVDAARSENAARSGNSARPASASPLDSLYALGSDAYRIVDRITSGGGRASSMRLLGATGVLTLGTDGAFRREPVWAVVRNGALAALPTLVH